MKIELELPDELCKALDGSTSLTVLVRAATVIPGVGYEYSWAKEATLEKSLRVCLGILADKHNQPRRESSDHRGAWDRQLPVKQKVKLSKEEEDKLLGAISLAFKKK